MARMKFQPSHFIRGYKLYSSTGSLSFAINIFKQGQTKTVMHFLSMGGKIAFEDGRWVARFGRQVILLDRLGGRSFHILETLESLEILGMSLTTGVSDEIVVESDNGTTCFKSYESFENMKELLLSSQVLRRKPIMNDLGKHFAENTGRLIHKWQHYFEIYDRHFSRFRGTDVHIVEFGVSQGGSLQMWKQYFGPNAKIFGIDINPHCKMAEEEQIKIFIGDQEDKRFLKTLTEKIPKIDILIDDGGHSMMQQITTFESLFSYIDKNGVYLCEDLHTSYSPDWGGGYKKRNTFIEYSKNFIDYINAWHSTQQRRLHVTDFTNSVHSLHYYDSVLVIEKRQIEKPINLMTGKPTIPGFNPLKKNLLGRLFG